MPISLYWSLSLYRCFLPTHFFNIKNMNIIEVNLSILTPENYQHIFLYQISSVSESWAWQTTESIIKKPLHFFGIKNVKLIENLTIFSLSSEYKDFLFKCSCSMKIATLWRNSFIRGLSPFPLFQI